MHTCVDMSFEVALQQIITEYDRNLCLKVRQLEIFDHLWKGGQDIIVSLPTGYGKSLVFHLCGKLLCAKLQLGQPGTNNYCDQSDEHNSEGPADEATTAQHFCVSAGCLRKSYQ